MFPIPFNFPFRKKDGSMTTIGEEISEGGGGGYTLPTASAETKGGIKIGSGLTMTGEVLSNNNPTPYSLPTASAETLGGIKVGTGLSIEEGVLNNSNPTPYSLPTASAETLGGIKVGTGLSIDESGVLSGGEFTKVWTNSSPSSQMGSEDIAIDGISNYTEFMVRCKYTTNTADYHCIQFTLLNTNDMFTGVFPTPTNNFSPAAGSKLYKRTFKRIATGINVGSCTYTNFNNTDGNVSNNYYVPYEIYAR